MSSMSLWGTEQGGEWIRQRRLALDLSQDELATRLRAAAQDGCRCDGHLVGKWERGVTKPGAHYRRALRKELGVPHWEAAGPSQDGSNGLSLTGAPCGTLSDVDRRLFLRAAAVIGSAAVPGGLAPTQLRDLLQTVARESRLAASVAEGTDLGASTLEQLHDDVRRIAAAYVTSPPLPLFVEMTTARDDVFQGLRGRARPTQHAELHLLAGQLLCLMANASLDLGNRQAAAQHARAAWSYGDGIGHDGLRAMARAMEALVAYWCGRYHDVLALTADGRSRTRAGSLLARLWALEARALAKLGRADAATRALATAHKVIGEGHDPLSDGVGGEFAYQPARLAGSTAIVLSAIGDHAGAAREAAAAVGMWQQMPSSERSYGCEALTLIDQAAAHVRLGEVDGAAEHLAPVLGLPDAHQLELYAGGLGTVRTLLDDPRYQGGVAGALAEQIDTFRAGLPPRLSA